MNDSKTSGSIYESYGGEENCKLKFPKTYEILQTNSICNLCEANDISAVRNSFLGIKSSDIKRDGTSYKVELLFDSITETYHTSGYLDVIAVAEKISTGEEITKGHQVTFFTSDERKNGTGILLEIEKEQQQDCRVILKSRIIEEKGVTGRTDTYIISEYDMIESDYSIAHPCRKLGHPESDPFINYYYWRSPEHGEYVDYKYPDGASLMCKFEGTAVAKEHAVRKIESAALHLMNENNWISYEDKCDLMSKIHIKDLGIEWKDIEDFNRRINELMKSNVGLVYYTLSVTCKLEDTGDKNHTFAITNIDADANYPVLRFNWGCLAAGTLIATPMGEIPIEKLHTGDLVITSGGGVARITNAYIGMEEEPFVVIRLENGREIKATLNHPFITAHGVEIANKIISGNQLMTQGGGYIKVEESYADFFGPTMVYNLEIEDGGIFFANGVASGDFVLQNSCSGEDIRSKLSPEWQMDYDSFMELL